MNFQNKIGFKGQYISGQGKPMGIFVKSKYVSEEKMTNARNFILAVLLLYTLKKVKTFRPQCNCSSKNVVVRTIFNFCVLTLAMLQAIIILPFQGIEKFFLN